MAGGGTQRLVIGKILNHVERTSRPSTTATATTPRSARRSTGGRRSSPRSSRTRRRQCWRSRGAREHAAATRWPAHRLFGGPLRRAASGYARGRVVIGHSARGRSGGCSPVAGTRVSARFNRCGMRRATTRPCGRGRPDGVSLVQTPMTTGRSLMPVRPSAIAQITGFLTGSTVMTSRGFFIPEDLVMAPPELGRQDGRHFQWLAVQLGAGWQHITDTADVRTVRGAVASLATHLRLQLRPTRRGRPAKVRPLLNLSQFPNFGDSCDRYRCLRFDFRRPDAHARSTDHHSAKADRASASQGISDTTLWRLERSGNFPRSIQISPGRVGYRESDIERGLSRVREVAQQDSRQKWRCHDQRGKR